MTPELAAIAARADDAIKAKALSVNCLAVEYHDLTNKSLNAQKRFTDAVQPEHITALIAEVARLQAALAEAEKLLKDTIRLTAAKQPTSSNSVYGYGIDEYEDD